MITLSTPPVLSGTELQQIAKLRSYLYSLSEQLNMSLNNISSDSFSTETLDEISGKQELAEAKSQQEQGQGELRSLIIKNAEIVESEIQEINTTLTSNYVAKSEMYGTFQETIHTEILETAAALQSNITVQSEVLGQYISTTNGYIRQGVVGYNGITPIIGIAIGQEITVTGEKKTVGGVEYDVIDKSHNMSIWTTEKLAFYVNGTEVAYFKNDSLTVNKISTGELNISSDWSITTNDGFTFKWIGGSQ